MVLATLVLLASIAWPALAGGKSSSERLICANNLCQIGRAIHLWAGDHKDRTPWYTPVAEGGTREPGGMGNPLRDNIWYEFGVLSNELAIPRFLVCPADQGVGARRRIATDFSGFPESGGFFAPGFKNQSVSYFIGVHASLETPRSGLGGDRNIRWDGANGACALGLSSVLAINYPVRAIWTNAIHGLSGNILVMDGSVDTWSSHDLQRALDSARNDDNSIDHYLSPF